MRSALADAWLTRRVTIVLAAAAVALSFYGCDSCNADHRVPFQKPAGGQTSPSGSNGNAGAATAFTPAESTALPKGTVEIDVDHVRLDTTPITLVAALQIDLDGDGNRDVIAVGNDETGAPTLIAAVRQGADFRKEAPIKLGNLATACTFQNAVIRTISTHLAAVTLDTLCGAVGAEVPLARVALLSLGAHVHLDETLEVLPPTHESPDPMSVALKAEDRDGDGIDDVVMTIALERAGHSTSVGLTWLDRSAGLARDAHEPENTFATMADDAKAKLDSDHDGAIKIASDVLALYTTLCRESEASRVRIGGHEGLSCANSKGAGHAAALLTIGNAKAKNVAAALAAYQQMRAPGLLVEARLWAQTNRALLSLPAEPNTALHLGPAHVLAQLPLMETPRLTFNAAEDEVSLREDPLFTWHLADDSVLSTPLETGSHAWFKSPTGDLAIVDVHRSCAGYALGIARVESIVDGVLADAYATEAVIEPRATSSSHACVDTPESWKHDRGGFRVLGWTQEGAWLLRGTELLFLALDTDGHATTMAVHPPADAILPTTFASGVATTDGHLIAYGTPFGIVLLRLGADATTTLLRPRGWATTDDLPTEISISPSGKKVAFMRAGALSIITRATR